MMRFHWQWILYALFGLGAIYLVQVDYSTKLESDVSSLLPTVESEEARLARRLISDEQGRVVYLEVSGLPDNEVDARGVEDLLLNALRRDALVSKVVVADQYLNADALRWVADHRLELLFPRWLRDKKELFAGESGGTTDFYDWATQSAVQDMEAFLMSPSAVDLARPELLDPLLLNIRTLLKLSDSGAVSVLATDDGSGMAYTRRYWLSLAASPLLPTVQSSFASLVQEIQKLPELVNTSVDIRYGGLVKLAESSRLRIQSDIFKINIISVLGVGFVAFLMLRKPWMLLRALPALVAGVIGAVCISFLVFDRVNALVLVIGSILIGTAIDYSIHLCFSEESESEFPTRKLVALACFSTVTGFSILIFADLALIRQVGVFVGAGLLSAFSIASVTTSSGQKAKTKQLRDVPSSGSHLFVFLAIAVLLLGGYGMIGLDWEDDIRNLEALDDEAVREDLDLRARFGAKEEGSLFLSTGSSFLEVFDRELQLMSLIKKTHPMTITFGLSEFMPNRADISSFERSRKDLGRFFSQLQERFLEAGYEKGTFENFFTVTSEALEGTGDLSTEVENLVDTFSAKLNGPLAGLIGQNDGGFWSLSRAKLQPKNAILVADEVDSAVLFSQLSFLNQTLQHHRETLLRFGVLALGLIGLIILISFGWRMGLLIVLVPLLAGMAAVGISHVLFGTLNMFHLIGCFLGGTIALDYALFTLESYRRDRKIPQSVWLSAGTTSASFLALSLSAIPVVQSLGTMVALLTCVTLLLLHSSRRPLRRFLLSNAP